MKCHPDVQTSSEAKETNLIAIQNLNAFLDSVEAKLKPAAKLMKDEKTVFEVDFCVVLEERIRGKKEEILCRRKVELAVPVKLAMAKPMSAENKRKYHAQVEKQLIKLLHMAGLETKKSDLGQFEELTDVEERVNRAWQQAVKDGDYSRLDPVDIQMARQQKYERNRDAFTASIDWKRYEQYYKDTLRDIEADRTTVGLIRDDPKERMAYLSEILSRVRVEEDDDGEGKVDPISQLIALRRLSLLFDEYFDDLSLEDLGRMWDMTTFVLTAPRDYNTSPSALYRRRKRKSGGDVMVNDGFAYALHADDSITIHIPVDFRDEELMAQLKRHVKDYQSLMDMGLEAFIPRVRDEILNN